MISESERLNLFARGFSTRIGRRLMVEPAKPRDEALALAILGGLQDSGLEWQAPLRAAAVAFAQGTLVVHTANLRAPVRAEVSRTVISGVLERRESLLRVEAPGSHDYLNSKSVRSLGLQSILCVPILEPMRPDRAIGVIYYDSRESHAFNQEDLDFVQLVAELLAPGFLCLESPREPHSHQLIIASLPLRRVWRAAQRQLQAGEHVLIGGEGGVGKSHMARQLQADLEPDDENPVCIDCADRANAAHRLFGLVSSEAGVTCTRKGGLITAVGGVMILESVDTLTLDLQARLAVELADPGTDLTIIATTSRSVPRLIKARRFAPELYAVLGGREFTIPPLRDRIKDIEEIARRAVEEWGYDLDEEMQRALEARRWSGNVRQLLQALAAVHRDALARQLLVLAPDALPPIAADAQPISATMAERSAHALTQRQIKSMFEDLPIIPFEDVAAALYMAALDRHNGNVSAAARALELHRNTFFSRLIKLGLASEAD